MILHLHDFRVPHFHFHPRVVGLVLATLALVACAFLPEINPWVVLPTVIIVALFFFAIFVADWAKKREAVRVVAATIANPPPRLPERRIPIDSSLVPAHVKKFWAEHPEFRFNTKKDNVQKGSVS